MTLDELDAKYGGKGYTAPSGLDALDEKYKAQAKPKAEVSVPPMDVKPSFDGNLQFATPWGTVDTGIGLPEAVNKRLAQLGSGFADFGLGARQVMASDKPTLESLVTGQTPADKLKLEALNKRKLDAGLNDDFAGKALNFAGKAAPLMAVPAVGGPIAGGALAGGLGGFLEPVAPGESRAANTAVGAAGGALLPAVFAGGRALLRPSGAGQELAEQAARYNIPVGVADVSNNKLVRAARSVMNDLPLTGTIGAAQKEAQQAAYNRAVGQTFGADATKLTPDVMSGAKKNIGNELDRLWNNNNVAVDPKLLSAIQSAKQQASTLPEGEGRRLLGWVSDLESKIVPDANGMAHIPGDVANKFQSSLGSEAGKAGGFLKDNLQTLRQELIGNFNRSVGGADADALTLARGQYKNFKTVEPLMDKGALGVAGREAGDVPAALLPEAVRKAYSGVSSNTAPPALVDLAGIGSRLLPDRVPQTGGSARAIIQNSAIGTALSAGALKNPATIGLVPLAAGAQWGLGAPAVTRALMNPKTARGLLAQPSLGNASLEYLMNSQRALPLGLLGMMPGLQSPTLE